MTNEDKEKYCIYQYLYVKPYKSCHDCNGYDDVNCNRYIPMVESRLEGILRIGRQIKMPDKDEQK